ncbi:hypothetical protein ANCCAN_27189 [Ancylostoma caninum]|uniref:Uncharacterized protein n=1 Tax=Ancylostoma caninum TaxID=29170 RepID=A0A368F665_ANCCA|nr:hypothetical protein ANCCAN_27189 [Ancylostoma caninum]
MWFFVAAAGFLEAVLVERACASYFIVDYENKARRWISTSIIVFTLSATFLFTISFMFMLYPVVAALAGGSLAALAALAVSAILYRRNRSQLLNLDKGSTEASIEYTLSIKFQLMENIRVMRVSKLISFTSHVYKNILINNFINNPHSLRIHRLYK